MTGFDDGDGTNRDGSIAATTDENTDDRSLNDAMISLTDWIRLPSERHGTVQATSRDRHLLIVVTAVWTVLGIGWLVLVDALTLGFTFVIGISGFAVALELAPPSHLRPAWLVRARRVLLAELALFIAYVPLRLYDIYFGF